MGKLKQHGMLVGAIAAQQAGGVNVDANVLKNIGTSHDVLEGDWLSYGRSLSETRYSPLKQIDTSNVSRLGLAWTYALGAGGGNQGELVVEAGLADIGGCGVERNIVQLSQAGMRFRISLRGEGSLSPPRRCSIAYATMLSIPKQRFQDFAGWISEPSQRT
jgi:hypothetical protein